jgi:hypothetical protein
MSKGSSPGVGDDCVRPYDGEHTAARSACEKLSAPNIGRCILVVLAIVLSASVLLACLALGIGVWIVKRPVTAKATAVFGRVESALDVADQNLVQVQASLARAAESLNSAREEQKKLAQGPQSDGALHRIGARALPRVAPDLGNAQEKLHTVAEAATVVNSVLEDVGNFPLISVTGLDLERLTEMNSRLADVGPAAWELSRLLGEADDSDAANAQVSRIERTLQTIQTSLTDYQDGLADVRQRTDSLRSTTLGWITPASVLISLVCLWLALSQVSVMAHARGWWARSLGSLSGFRESHPLSGDSPSCPCIR